LQKPQKLDLAALTEGMDAPYRPIPLASLGELEASVFVCEGPKPWHRKLARDEVLVVLEGVITVEGPAGKMIVNEGDLASAPRSVSYAAHSGMRSNVLLLEAIRERRDSANGFHAADAEPPGTIERRAVALDVRKAPAFEWAEVAHAGHHTVAATRLVGASAPYRVSGGTVLVVVFRGMLDYDLAGESENLVGSQMLVLTDGTDVTFRSDHGATVFFVAPTGAQVPIESTSGRTESAD
jgi:mannose-6-phosphate isomerase-like protein (cupin superfamily)